MALEKSVMVTISSSHVPHDKRDRSVVDPVAKRYLDANGAAYREGWILALDAREGRPAWLAKLADEVALEGAQYLRIDADGPIVLGYEVYDW